MVVVRVRGFRGGVLSAAVLIFAAAVAGCSRGSHHEAVSTPISATPSVTASQTLTSNSTSGPSRASSPSTASATRRSRAATRLSRAATAAPVLPIRGSTASATQLISVAAVSTKATRATLQAWSKTASGWVRVGPAVPAWLGHGGMTAHASENFNGTPIGSFTITQAFGNNSDPGTKLPYFRSGPDDWWSGDSSSPTYNSHQHCAPTACPFKTTDSENLYDAGWVYGYAVVIDYNTRPAVTGKGSAFFLHVTEDKPTQGCVSIARTELVRILRWLDPAAHPRILMGIG
jgi:L,D-peptidoglycan transpeptidase YkuD (ErfK/YbiS/YcfS/YnhG family)